MKTIATIAGALAVCVPLLGADAPPAFTKKPTATKDGDKVRVEFAVDRKTDVAVFVEDAKGKIICHLAAGVLGAKAPAPLKANSLEQSLVWDGKADYGASAGPGPFTVRVALGLRAAFDKVLISDPHNIGGVQGLAVGPDGTAYVMIGTGGSLWHGQQMVAFNRDGTYQRMVMPFPANLKTEEVEGFDVVELDGRPAPLVHDVSTLDFYGGATARRAGMAVTPGGQVLTLLKSGSIGALSAQGGAPWGRYVGPRLIPGRAASGFGDRPFVAVSADGRWAYLSGLSKPSSDRRARGAASAVYRVPLPDRSPTTVFFGKADETGRDEVHLGGAPRGLALDGKGHLLIADYANDRVVVAAEADGGSLGSFPVEKPDSLAVDPATGAVYVTRLVDRGAVELVKFGPAEAGKAPKALATLSLPRSGTAENACHLALDAAARPPVVWLGTRRSGLLRIEDRGNAFGEAARIDRATIGNAAFLDVSVDRFRDEVYVRGRMEPYWWFRFNEATGELTRVKPDPVRINSGSSLAVGLDGSLYLPGWPDTLMRFARDGSAAPWAIANKGYPPNRSIEGKPAPPPAHGRYVPVSMTYLTHTVGVRHDGHIFVFEPDSPGGRPPKMLIEYLPSGERVPTPIIWKVSDTAVGPKFDPQGNIYIAEQVKQPDRLFPGEFKDVVGEVKPGSRMAAGVKDSILTIYGSILKFSPKGGMINFAATPRGKTSSQRMGPTGPNPFEGEPKLDPSLTTEPLTFYRQLRLHSTSVTGAEWIRTGISHVGFESCNCENTRFDVDEFGRVFYPDLGRFRVAVLDTNGNPITEFGGYGNADSAGPGSRVPTPEIAFSWLIGVGVTDRYAYMGDSLNRRFLRARLVYESEATCPVPQ